MLAQRQFSAAAFLAASLLVLQTAAPVARRAQLPTGREVVARHVAAVGGTAALKAVKSMHVRGRVEMPAQKIAGDVEVFSARPAKILSRILVPGIGRIEQGYDGKVGWTNSAVAGPELMSGRRLSEVADAAWFDGPLHEPDHVREVTTVDRAAFDGKNAFRVKVVFASGNEQIEYFDAESGLQIGFEVAHTTPQGVVPTVNFLRNYRKFGPLMLPTTFVLRYLGFEQVLTVTTCEYDVVPDSAFEPPSDVRALMTR